VLTMKITKFWDVTPCRSATNFRRFVGMYCLEFHGRFVPKSEAVPPSETSVNFYQNTRCHIPEDGRGAPLLVFKRTPVPFCTAVTLSSALGPAVLKINYPNASVGELHLVTRIKQIEVQSSWK
jgi:hypothetical protein